MHRFLTWATAIILVGTAVGLLIPLPAAGAGEDYGGDEMLNLDLFWYGVVDTNNDGLLNTTQPTGDTDDRSPCPPQANTDQDGPAAVGTWRTEPLRTNLTVSGNLTIEFWAQADDGDAVDEVTFTFTLLGATFDSDTHGVSDTPVKFIATHDYTTAVTRNRNQQISMDVQYDGNDAWNPLSADDQIYLLSSSQDHPSRINLDIDHVREVVHKPKIDRAANQFLLNTTITSAFGNEDLVYDSWSVEIIGKESGFEAQDFEAPVLKDDTGDDLSVLFTWNYNAEEAPSDSYYVTVYVDDIQGNSWSQTRNDPIELVYSNRVVNLHVSEDGIMVDGQPFHQKVVVDKRVTVSAILEADGDTNVQHNPVEWSLYAVRLGNATPVAQRLFHETISHLEVGSSKEVSVDWTPSSKGDYRLYIELDESEWVAETDETDNVAELFLEVIPDKESQSQAFWDRIQDDPTVAALVGLVLVATVLIIVVAVYMVKGGGGRRYRDFADDDDWEDDF